MYMQGKKLLSAVLFLGLAVITFYVIFRNQDIGELWNAIEQMDRVYLMLAILSAMFFVSVEGILIWYLFRSFGEKTGFWRCIKYSFVGFFLFGNNAFCQWWSAYAIVLYGKGWT